MTNLQAIYQVPYDDLVSMLASIADKGELSDRLCDRCMKRHGGKCLNPSDCEVGDYNTKELIKMYLCWEAQI